MRRPVFAACALLLALPARAQVEIRPRLPLPSAPAAFVLAPPAALAPALAPALALAPEALGAPSLPAAAAFAVAAPAASPVAAPLPPASARAAALGAALAEFSRADLKSASAGDSREAGETLMLRALGEAAPGPAAAPVEFAAAPVPPLAAAIPSGRRVEPKIYLLSKPLRETIKFGPASIALHVAYSVMWEAIKAAVAYKATGSVAAAATVFAFELTTSPVMLTARSLGDLGLRYWRRKLAVLKELARTPGATRVKVLTTGDVTFAGPLARRKDNTGLIVVEADRELPETIGRFGAPIPLGDAASSRVRLVYVTGGKASETSWTPALKDLLEGRPIPRGVAAAWRAASKGARPPLRKLLDASNGKERVEAALIGPDGGERAIGAIAEGPAARKLAGLSLLDRARSLLGRELPLRAIPLSDSAVERPGDPREPGLAAALRRGWARLTGRLIVATP